MKFVAFNELFKFNSWGHNRVLSAADSLTDAQLDQPIEMGPGSLRATLNHLYSAERVWLDRWKGITPPRARPDPAGVTVAKLKEELTELSAERNEFLRGKSDADLVAIQSVRNMKGEATDITLGDMLLHVINHAIHHRAQAVNMIRRVGGKPPAPGADYIFMKIEPGAEPTPPLDLGTIRAWLATADWARTRITAAAQSLTDEALDR